MLTAFLSALLATLAAGAIARAVAGFFAVGRSVSVAGFCVALGFALGRFSYSGPLAMDAARALSAAAGAIAALIVLWVWLLRKARDASNISTN